MYTHYTSSNLRMMEAGGKNYDKTKGVVAHNEVHHSRQHPPEVKLTVVKR